MLEHARYMLRVIEREYTEELEKAKKSAFWSLTPIFTGAVAYTGYREMSEVATIVFTLGIFILISLQFLYQHEFGFVRILREIT